MQIAEGYQPCEKNRLVYEMLHNQEADSFKYKKCNITNPCSVSHATIDLQSKIN
jgi:hypothetical protein